MTKIEDVVVEEDNKMDKSNEPENNEIVESIINDENKILMETPIENDVIEEEVTKEEVQSDNKVVDKKRNSIVMRPRSSIHNVSYYK